MTLCLTFLKKKVDDNNFSKCILKKKESIILLKAELISWDFIVTGRTSEHHYLSHRDRLVPKAPMTASSLEVSHSTDGKVRLKQIQIFGPSMSRKHTVPHSEHRDKALIPFLFSLWLMLLCLKCLIVGRVSFWVWFAVGFGVLGF